MRRIASAFEGVPRSEAGRELKVSARIDLDKIDDELRCIEVFMLKRLPLTPERWARMVRERSRCLARRSENNILGAVERLCQDHDPGDVYQRVKDRCSLVDSSDVNGGLSDERDESLPR